MLRLPVTCAQDALGSQGGPAPAPLTKQIPQEFGGQGLAVWARSPPPKLATAPGSK